MNEKMKTIHNRKPYNGLRLVSNVLISSFLALSTTTLFSADLDRAIQLRESGNTLEAIRLLKSERKPTLEENALLGKLYLDRNEYKTSLYYYNLSCPALNVAWCFNEWGVAFMMYGVYKNAWGAFTKAVEMEPENAQYHSNLGLCYFYRGKPDDAGKQYKLALQYDPQNETANINYAVLLIRKKMYEEATTRLQNVLSTDDSNHFALLYLGYAYYRQKQYALAIEQYDKALSFNPNSADLYLYRAYAYYEMNALGQAEADLNRAEALQPKHPKVGILRSMIQRRRGY
ncbi:MAG: tetratricopeptide repeat protein [Leptospirales bacterium]